MNPDLRFVAHACLPPLGDERRALIARLAREVGDWGEVARLARAHRVEGHVAHTVLAAVSDLPDEMAEHFRQAAGQVKARAMKDLAETLRIARAIEAAEIRYAVLKGVPLGLRAYATPNLKQSWDIDLLVDPADAVQAAVVLGGLGYAPYLPPRPLNSVEFRRWSAVSKEAELQSPSGRTVELHWGLADHPMLLAGMGIAQANVRVELLGSHSVATLDDDATLAYLAVHGAFHGWSRLKWLADFAAFLDVRSESDRAELLKSARRWVVGRSIDQALLLSNQFLSTGFETGSDPVIERLSQLGATVLVRRGESPDLDRDSVAQSAITAGQRMLFDGSGYARRLSFQKLRGTEDRRHLPLPAGLNWLYWVIRPFTATWRVARRTFQNSSHLPLS